MNPEIKFILATIIAAVGISLTSCTGGYADAQAGYYKPASPIEPDAEFGLFISSGAKLDALIEPQK